MLDILKITTVYVYICLQLLRVSLHCNVSIYRIKGEDFIILFRGSEEIVELY